MDGNEEKQDPALIFPGPVALVAGPGSGKTTRLALRIKHLVEERGTDPEEITVITFTREAARNMKERLIQPPREGEPNVTLAPGRHPSLICTMHSLGHHIIKENAGRLGITSEFRLLTDWRLREVLFEDAARLCRETFKFGRVCNDCKATMGEPRDERERRVFETYQQILHACDAIDHDDQIIMACQLLRDYEDVREAWRQKARHLLVDEYQDINKPQLQMIRLLSGPDASGLFVVGDDDQSIYRFRGGSPGFIRNFEKDFGGQARVVAIPDCFRCQPHVIKAAHAFIEVFNPERIRKPEPVCKRPEGPSVVVHTAPSDAREAKIMAAIIAEVLDDEGDVLVLLPKDGYAEPLKAELAKRRIAFDAPRPKASGATVAFQALRNWLAAPGDNLAFRKLLQTVADSKFLGIPGPLARTAATLDARQDALAKFSSLWGHVLENGMNLRDALREAAPTDELYGKLDRVAADLALSTEGSPLELAQTTFEPLKPWANSRGMLDELAALPADNLASGDGDAPKVRIMTMRLSKGLEAETVIVIGLEKGAFPGNDDGSPGFEEEARLFYVSMTRAKKELHLFHATNRSGGMTFKAQSFNLRPSPFLGGLPDEHRENKYHPSATKRTAKK